MWRARLPRVARLRAVVSAVIGVDTIDMDAANAMGVIVGHGAMPENYLGVAARIAAVAMAAVEATC